MERIAMKKMLFAMRPLRMIGSVALNVSKQRMPKRLRNPKIHRDSRTPYTITLPHSFERNMAMPLTRKGARYFQAPMRLCPYSLDGAGKKKEGNR
jgi:hypothetical protein